MQGKGELKGVLEQYNIAVTDAAGNTRATGDVLNDLANVMSRADSEAERLRIAFKAFDSEGAALVNMLKGGSAGLDDYRQKARRLGLVIRDDLIDNAATANDQLTTLGRVLKTQVTAAVVEMAPKITEISSDILTWVEANQSLIQQDLQNVYEGIASGLKSIAGAYKTIDDLISVDAPDNYLAAYRTQLENTLHTQQSQLDMFKRLGSEGSAAYDALIQKLKLTQDHLKIVKSSLIDQDLKNYFSGIDSSGGFTAAGGSGGEPLPSGKKRPSLGRSVLPRPIGT